MNVEDYTQKHDFSQNVVQVSINGTYNMCAEYYKQKQTALPQ